MPRNKGPLVPKRHDYQVGYGKPPKHTRFMHGKSGNPKGRPKGSRNLKSDLEEELKRLVVIREDGVPKSVSKQRAMVMALCNEGMKANPRLTRILVELILRFDEEKVADAVEMALSEDDRKIIENFKSRLLDTNNTDGDGD